MDAKSRPPKGDKVEAAMRLSPHALRAAAFWRLLGKGLRPLTPVEGLPSPAAVAAAPPPILSTKGGGQMGREGGKSPISAVFLRILGLGMSLGCSALLWAVAEMETPH